MKLNNATKVGLLYELKEFTERELKTMLLPVRKQKGDEREPQPRPPDVYLMRLPEMQSTTNKAPYILHQVLTGKHGLENVNHGIRSEIRMGPKNIAVVRTVACVFDPDVNEGGLTVLNVMEALRTAIQRQPLMLNNVFEFDETEGLEQLFYLDSAERVMAPYYMAEMLSVWKLPPVERIDAARVTHGYPAKDPRARVISAEMTGGLTPATRPRGETSSPPEPPSALRGG